MKFFELITVPPDVVTAMGPVVAPVGTRTLIVLAVSLMTVVAVVPLKVTSIRPERLVPFMVTTLFTFPFFGVKVFIVGEGDVLVTLSTND